MVEGLTLAFVREHKLSPTSRLPRLLDPSTDFGWIDCHGKEHRGESSRYLRIRGVGYH
jgi:hypothetical protein